MIISVILNVVLQIAGTIGSIYLFGWLIALCNQHFYKNLGNRARLACYITGFLGTPIHECSHALFCLIFGHKINQIKLFQINDVDGILGYVNHSYNPKNIYMRIGNFFIGTAPIICISGILYAISLLLIPQTMSYIVSISKSMVNTSVNGFFSSIANIFQELLFAMANWQFWVFLLISIFLALHMTMSQADMKGASSGLLLVIGVVVMVNIALSLVGDTIYDSFCGIMTSIVSVFNIMLILSLIVSFIAVLISLIINKIFKL